MQSDRRSARACPEPPRDESWRDSALCAQSDPELFFPDKGGRTWPAKKVCARCPVPGECLAWALAYDIRYGIWGGLTEDQRSKLRGPQDGIGKTAAVRPC